MEQREVMDQDNTNWVCVQAFGGLKAEAAEEAADRVETTDGKVPVVCTPNGGAQTVRLQLQRDWLENYSDEQLVTEITNARAES
ncbi:hypothetical protein AAE02nite_35820 [Adhaeribacter aerolatus]|uniref:Uncharacterized protein n=1 Tax=Adhaeribacter aerolatus TaxID=670289 RepID=A0A512B1R6_9BACT|nr:hypothetical protein [Adhaeribacter aerolatus]GEO05918.1 hypothetical protein AAE02nite_35820 [Adhaeribacter aerolatus]